VNNIHNLLRKNFGVLNMFLKLPGGGIGCSSCSGGPREIQAAGKVVDRPAA
jgi:hypothetical protein